MSASARRRGLNLTSEPVNPWSLMLLIPDEKKPRRNCIIDISPTGDSRSIKVWDAQTETQGLDLDTSSESPVTAIVSDMDDSQ
ncbi:hypothetical protein MLD55_19210, partial [Alcanivorax sp. MM125-6]|nr:hypothetical protein [Alcanivorax sp. MM125-6]